MCSAIGEEYSVNMYLSISEPLFPPIVLDVWIDVAPLQHSTVQHSTVHTVQSETIGPIELELFVQGKVLQKCNTVLYI